MPLRALVLRARLVPLALGLLLVAGLAAEPLLWKPCTTQELREASDIVVVGKIVEIERGAAGPDAVDRATLRVDRTLFGWTDQETVVLAFPGRDRGRLSAGGTLVRDQNAAYIRYDIDQEGVFFLLGREDGTYTANHPARFKPTLFLAKVESELVGL